MRNDEIAAASQETGRMIAELLGPIARLIQAVLGLLGLARPKLRVRPHRGPSGTQVQLELSGLAQDEPITILIGPSSSNARADASGTASVTERLYGTAGQTIEIVAIIGVNAAVERRLTATFRVEGETP